VSQVYEYECPRCERRYLSWFRPMMNATVTCWFCKTEWDPANPPAPLQPGGVCGITGGFFGRGLGSLFRL
jgi:hypothetical protein